MYGLIEASVKANLPVMKSLSALHLYGSVGIGTFGAILGGLLGWDGWGYFWLWVAAGLLVYNVDRLTSDPADTVNVPERTVACARHRRFGVILVGLGALLLVAIPVWTMDWRLLALTLLGSVVCCGYSLPLFGIRLKAIPLLKTLFAPTVVLLAWIVPPLLRHGLQVPWQLLLLAAFWAWTLLLFNMLLCDQRDLAGDAAAGTVSLPLFLGPNGTHRLLRGLLVSNALMGAALQSQGPVWFWLAMITPPALGCLLWAVRKTRGEAFYEWAVEGLLFLPLAAAALARVA